MRALAGLLLLASVSTGCAIYDGDGGGGRFGGRSCTLIGCVNGARLSFRVATSREQLLASTIELCRGAQCSRATPTEVPGSAGSGSGGQLVGPVSATFTVWGPESGRFKIEVQTLGEGPYPYGLADGETHTLRLLDASGAKLAETSAAITYQESYPNGKECDQYACRSATHDGGDITPTVPSDAGAGG